MGISKSGRYKPLKTGFTVGKLTLLEELPEKDKFGRYFVKCKCVCGNETITRKGAFISGRTKSCGCAQIEAVKKTNEFKRGKLGWSNFKNVYFHYKRGALKRKLNFELTENEFFEISQKPCHYCGSKPTAVCRQKNKYGDYVYNGIDRKDNLAGYTLKNCVPACKLCNHAKWTLSVDQFMAWIARVFMHQNPVVNSAT